MLMQHPPTYHPHSTFNQDNRSINHVGDETTADRNTPNHANSLDYNLYKGPLQAHQYSQQQTLIPTFQHVIAEWLKSGKQFLKG